MDEARCDACTARLTYVDDGEFGTYLCDGCGGAFEAPHVLEPLVESYLTVMADERDGAPVLGGFARTASLEVATREFELAYREGIYRRIDEVEAAAILTHLLERGMAYSEPLVRPARAREIADGFVAVLSGAKLPFFTARRFDFETGGLASGWNPVTSATFDAGVIAVGKAGSACAYFTDED